MVINRKMCLWENAAETQVAFRQWAGVHFSTVRQWDRRKHMAVEWKLTWLFSDSARHPVALSSVVGHTGSGQYGRKEEGLDSAKKKKIPLICFQSSFILPPTLPATLSYLTQLIETLNGKIRTERNPAFLWIVDWTWWRCGVLLL